MTTMSKPSHMSLLPSDQLPAGVDASMLTCSSMVSFNSSACDDNGFFKVICGESCQFRGPCTGDEALAVLFSDDNMTCATLPDYDAAISGIIALMGAFTSGGLTGGSDDQMTAEELAVLPTLCFHSAGRSAVSRW